MKKLLLLFASMFLALGTSFAQDKEEENAAFALEYVSPQNGSAQFTVYKIILGFNKEVIATLPEGGIDVKNNTTGDIVKITRIDNNEWLEKTTVHFLFEQKSVVGKDDKEEMQDQYIETPGEWSYTIPAGCIKSVDNEEFAEQTFTFNIASSMNIESISPSEGVTTLDKIEITFEKPVTNVVMPENGMYIADDLFWDPVTYIKKDVTFSDDRKTVTLELEEPITTPGTYNFNIKEGIFASEDGAINESAYTPFYIIDPTPSFSTNYNDGDKVKELGNQLEITFNNVNEIALVEGADAVTVYMPGGGDCEGTATVSDNKIIVTFDQNFKEVGEYYFYIPEGMFTMDGAANESRSITVTLYTFEITPLEVVSVTPVAGPVNQIDKIVIKYNQVISLSMDEDYQTISYEITLKGENKNYKLTYCPTGYNASDVVEYLVNAEWDNKINEYKSTPITETGTYTLDLENIVVDYAGESYIDEWGWQNTKWHGKNGSCKGTYTWTIENTAIEEVKGENGEQAIYDLTGRRVEKVTNAGVYIVNGKKVLVK